MVLQCSMGSALQMAHASFCSVPKISSLSHNFHKNWSFLHKIGCEDGGINGAVLFAYPCSSSRAVTCAAAGVHKKRSSLESLFCYDKPIPEEIIETPIGLSLDEKNVGENPRCPGCQAKGAIVCATCSGSGLYVDSILESQGIIVKVRCLGCGGTGNTMCSECGGRGHI